MDQDVDRDADRVDQEVLVLDQVKARDREAQADQVARRISKADQFRNV